MNKYIVFIFPLVFLCSFRSIVANNDQVMNAARSGLAGYLEKIPAGSQDQYGFAAGDDLQKCTVGKPYQMLAVTIDFLRNPFVADPLTYAADLQPGNEWRVPVVLNGANHTLLTVANNQGNCQVVNLGGAELSVELQQKSANAGADDNFYLFRVYQLSCDFFVDAKGASLADAAYFPLQSAIMAIPSLSGKPSYTLSELLPIIKGALNQQAKN